MAEEVKKAPKPVDVNSAKYKLGKIAADAYTDAFQAKKEGKIVAWVSSNFPVEIPETLGIATVYPENQAAGIAARGAGERMCNVAEADAHFFLQPIFENIFFKIRPSRLTGIPGLSGCRAVIFQKSLKTV